MEEQELKRRILKIENALECRIVERLNRFVVQIQLGGNYYRAYINNTGRLFEFLVKDKAGFCLKRATGGKTEYQLFAIKEESLGAIIDTQLQMKAFEKAMEMALVPWLKGYKFLRRNVRLGKSLIDYLLECDGQEVYLEVKSAVLKEKQYAMYPDCPSSRGRKHVKELTDCLKQEGKAVILFMAALSGVTAFKPNKLADPELSELLLEAHQAGVKLKSIGIFYHPEDSFVYLFDSDLGVVLE